MNVCANRDDNPGFFTPCSIACNGPCKCATELRDETQEDGGE